MKSNICAIAIFFFALSGMLNAQSANETRIEDHFYKRRVLMRLDLPEKLNASLQTTLDPGLYSGAHYKYTNGVVQSLLAGIKEYQITAVNPDDLESVVTWDQIVEEKLGPRAPRWGEGDEYSYDNDETDYDDRNDPFSQASTSEPGPGDFAELETSIEIIEDRIFDKAKSDMVYVIRYIRLVWIDPSETMPDKTIACVPYDENTKAYLDQCLWQNRHNEAENRSVKEILELRLFNPYILSVSGYGAKTMEESAFRAQQLIEYEHHLYEY